jgi:hypothetical protein
MGTVFEAAGAGFIKRMEALLAEGDDGALGRLAARFSKELAAAVALLIEQMAARHALLTKSSLAGRPYEDSVEERLIALARPLGDTVTRCADMLGQARSRAGDFTITMATEAVRGEADVRIVVEAKRRCEKAPAFSPRGIQDSLTGARRNRAAAGGIFVAEFAGALPLALGFHEFEGANVAVAFGPAGDDIGLAVAYRLVRLAIIQGMVDTSGEEIDRDAYRRIVSEVRAAMGKLEVVRGAHQSALNGINKAAAGVSDLGDTVLRCLRQLDELMGASDRLGALPHWRRPPLPSLGISTPRCKRVLQPARSLAFWRPRCSISCLNPRRSKEPTGSPIIYLQYVIEQGSGELAIFPPERGHPR